MGTRLSRLAMQPSLLSSLTGFYLYLAAGEKPR